MRSLFRFCYYSRISPKTEVNTEAPKVSQLREQFEQAQFIKDRFLVPPDMARRSQEESAIKVTEYIFKPFHPFITEL